MTDEQLRSGIERTFALIDRIARLIGENSSGEARKLARRERARRRRALKRRLARIGIAIGLISLAAIGVGLFIPIGMFGFFAAVGLAIGVTALLAVWPAEPADTAAIPAHLPNAELVQRFDGLLYRTRPALPSPAQSQIDALSARLPHLSRVLERVDELDPSAQDARRLLATHLPGLIDRYCNVPAAYRGERDGEGLSVDQRLIEGLRAGREALEEISDRLARDNLRALETQGRFIQSRYGAPGED